MRYDYLCDRCSHRLEANQSITAKALKKCPKCGAMRLRRLISGGNGFVLKGGGWFRDGYSSRKEK